MKNSAMRYLFVWFSTLSLLPLSAYAQEAGPEEIVQMVRAGVELLQEKGAAGLEEINNPDLENNPWVFKGTNVFVYECDKGLMVGTAFFPKLRTKDLRTMKDIKGNMVYLQLCEAASRPDGGWVEYWWPKPGGKVPERKVAYMLQVPGAPYQVGAGIYDDEVTIESLEKFLN